MSSLENTSQKPEPDWSVIELDYRAGIKSLRQIADEHGVSHPAITKRAKRLGWERDLSARINAKADALVSKAAVTTAVTAETRITEKAVIDANATAIKEVRLAHRKDIQRSRGIVMRLLDELELQTGPENAELLEQLGDLMRREDDKGQDRLNDLYHKIISLPGRAKTMKDLGESLRVLVGLERQAFGMPDKSEGDGDGGGSPAAYRHMTDAERAVRLQRMLSSSPEAVAALLASATGSK